MTPFAATLLRWYEKEGRDLPWRKTTDPYAIWVSEIMLQQTQVATVLPYYRRFLKTFPTIQALSAAPLEAVLAVWQGLGYYARARHLARAARLIVTQFGGLIPPSKKALLSLPGIGRSTAGAILNIAFSGRHPVLDGNVKRVLIRYFCIRGDPQGERIRKKLWRLAEQILPAREVGDFIQAILDLGATLCLPKGPKCALCPVKEGCLSYQKGLQEALPRKRVSRRLPHYDYAAFVLQKGERVLIRKRPDKGFWGGLWEFPATGRIPGTLVHPQVDEAVILFVSSLSFWFQIKQTFSHFKMTLHLFRGTVEYLTGFSSLRWVSMHRLLDYPMAAAHRKIAGALTETAPFGMLSSSARKAGIAQG